MRDKVHIENLQVETAIGPDSWNQINPQQCYLSMEMLTDFSKAAEHDDLTHTLNYAVICREVGKFVGSRTDWGSLGNLSKSVTKFVMSNFPGVDSLKLKLQTRTGHIRSDDISCVIEENRRRDEEINTLRYDLLCISNLKLLTLIGVFPFERLQKQYVTLDLKLPWPKQVVRHATVRSAIERVVEHVEHSKFLTVEALAESVAKIISSDSYFAQYTDFPIDVKVIKLNAITATSGVGVSCVRSVNELRHLKKPLILPDVDEYEFAKEKSEVIPHHGLNVAPSDTWNTAYLAFGSNVGDRLQNIRTAIDLLNQRKTIRVKCMSSLFESEPMYFKDQESFLNGCLKIQTSLSPHELLVCCKEIEYDELKRVKKFDNGPRTIDLDIILFLNGAGEPVMIDDEKLTVPHKRLLERSFVLEPLCELIPPNFVHPLTAEPLIDHLNKLSKKGNDEDRLFNLVPVGSSGSTVNFLKFQNVTEEGIFGSTLGRGSKVATLVMAIVNTTPDSFSDSGELYCDLDKQLSCVKEICSQTLRLHEKLIIDVGGCSTRPNSPQPSEEEELRRVIPTIQAIKSCPDLPSDKVIISVDTYRSNVAQKAINAGASIVNDISGGSFDSSMFSVIAANPNVAYVLSHTRGDIATMAKLTNYEESQNGKLSEYISDKICKTSETATTRIIGRELAERYFAAVNNGVARWQIIMDPGIGFAKNGDQNLQIIRQLPLLKSFSCTWENGEHVSFRNLPWLVGPSRKKFIGKITKEENPSDRDFATGAVITASIGFGADIVRVHNAKDCAKAVKVADALYKQLP
ncbi:hypothetical protein HG536_0B01220 [Torulaspora globosa]|uniref:Folic acid synthesis protein fol1 n=1 Tax=Torulaspora globosa TaxID=48254 RepID=A0A7G3ZCM5_9SACH|nr:uncharacterized protein HG536_0B01220 [Torulaspora globosa]QLL31261.1 hypothetical protein HG536_0B01220 [Torulaspora globosa]